MESKENYFVKTAELFNDYSSYFDQKYVCSVADAKDILAHLSGVDRKYLDGKGNMKRMLAEDVYNIYVGVNIWCYLFSEVTSQNPDRLLMRIKMMGLQGAIKEADDYRLFLLSETQRGQDSLFWQDYFPSKYAMNRITEKHSKWFRDTISVLGCLRKIRINCLDYSFMVEEFLDTNTKCGYFNKSPWVDYGSFEPNDLIGTGTWMPSNIASTREEWELTHPWVGSRILDDLAEIISVIFRSWSQDTSLFSLPPGASYEKAHTYYEKYKLCVSQQVWLREHGVNFTPSIYGTETSYNVPADCNRWTAVPKSYKTGRGVAPEPVARQVLGYQVDSGLRKCLRRFGIDLSDQGRNRELCSKAKQYKLATVDKSSASDLISLGLVKELFKYCPEILEKLMEVRTNYVEIRGRKYKNNRCFTMGNACTFSVETAIFLALAVYAVDLNSLVIESYYRRVVKQAEDNNRSHGMLTGEAHIKALISELYIGVYGDDVIIPDFAYDTYCELANKLGFIINHEKSYSGKLRYRESCGVEYISNNGKSSKSYPITGIYYPRGTSKKATAELLGLQHKYVLYPSVDYFVTGLILDAFPEMTASEVPTDPAKGSFDLWHPHPVVKVAPDSPYATKAYTVQVTYTARARASYKAKFVWPNGELSPEGIKLYEARGLDPDKRRYLIWNPFEKHITLRAEVLIGHDAVIQDPKKAAEITLKDLLIKSLGEDWECVGRPYYRVVSAWMSGKMPSVYKESPHYVPNEYHYVASSESSVKKITDPIVAAEVEDLMYQLTLGSGIEHINSSDFTEPENQIRDRLDLLGNRRVYLKKIARI